MIRLSIQDYDAMTNYARSKLPEEACGLLAGTMDGEYREVKKIYFLTNIEHSPMHFTMNPKEQLQAIRDMRKHGYTLIGNWHSHPKTPSRPSNEDIRLAYDEQLSYMILSLMNSKECVLRSFRIQNHQSTMEEVIL